MAEIPTYSVDAKDRTASFYCPACRKRHIHGRPSVEDVPEHRVAHCVDGTHHPSGYYIVLKSA